VVFTVAGRPRYAMRTKLQQWGAVLLVMGVVSLILPAFGMQLRILNLFGGGTPALSIAFIVLGAALRLVGAMSGKSVPSAPPKKSPPVPESRPGPAPAPPASSTPRVANCPKCGAKAIPADRFWRRCGNPLPHP
jgi:hypothetical protein